MNWRDYAWRFTVSKTTAKSYLERVPPEVRDLAEKCAEAFVKERDKPAAPPISSRDRA